ncbi:MAG TPA: 3-oxoacyl-ACP reductase FabG [Caulobacteraceae bacterium]|nr:3-oxoacyl-ACP reductase FabG [Caulobacteraceae bacterium]
MTSPSDQAVGAPGAGRLLEGRIALVTGATRGIGRATAELFAAHGAHVLLNGRDADRAGQAAEEIGRAYPDATVEPCVFDVGDAESIKLAFTDVHRRHKRLDVLVNNAGVLRDALVGMVSGAMLEEVMRINFTGSFLCAQMAARLMSRRRSGSIVNVSSIIGRYGNPGQAAYASSKAAVLGLTFSLAKELGPEGIRVNAIAPGFIATDMIEAVPQERRDSIQAGIRMGRLGKPEEVAATALFLASDLSAYVTGQVIGVDGGMTV